MPSIQHTTILFMEDKNPSATHLTPEDLHIEPNANHSQANLNANNSSDNKESDESISFGQLFRFADSYDKMMMFVGTFGGLCLGASTPVFILFWGQFTDVFNSNVDVIVDEAKVQLMKFIYLGIGTLFMGWAMIACWLITGERQAAACRKAYFAALLRQEIGWYDCIDQSSLSSSFSSDTLAYQGALGEKIAMMIQSIGTGIGGITVAFTQGWLMTLVCLAGIPLIGISGFVYMKSLQLKSKEFQKIYSKAGGQAEQAFYSIKTVKQLNGEQHQHKSFLNMLQGMELDNLKAGVKIAIGFGLLSGSMFILYSLGYWFGSNCVQGNSHCPPSVSGQNYTAGNVITIFFSVLVACFYFSQLSPALKKIEEGKDAAVRIYKVIDRQPMIKSPENGLKPDRFLGRIKFERVTFAYPKEPTKNVLNDITIEFDVNNTALVGESGCGKSTILQLIMRFYDPQQGRVLLDGIDIRDIDLTWLRNLIGYVGQQPVLFATSIKQNLLLGQENATDEEIEQALHQAEAYDFVNELQNKLQTYVGSGGGQLSGGQKQRIAIARALLKKPRILLLDEATSALDRKNEKLIQHTLNKVSQGLTTVTVAHRVRTIMSSDIIYVIDRGSIKEKGHFSELSRYKNYKDNEDQNEEVETKQLKKTKKDTLTKQPELVVEQKKERKLSFAEEEDKKKAIQKSNLQLIAKHNQGIYKRVFGYLNNHRLSFVLGIFLTILLGLVYPIFSLFLSQIINALFDLESSSASKRDDGRHNANIASLVFLLLGIGIILLTLARDVLTYLVGNQITNNIRDETYLKILKMPIFWFDRPDNNCGVLSTRLGTDCQTINGMATTYIYIIIQCLSTLLAAMIIAFIYQWRISLIALGSMPLIMLAGFIRSKFRTGLMEQSDKAYKDSAQIVMESLTNIRTVVSFGVQNTVMHKYERHLDKPLQSLRYDSLVSGFFFGLSQVINFLVFGILFYIGTIFMRDYGVSLLDVFTAIYQIFFAGITIGNNSNFLPDISEAKLAASHIFEILDSEDESQLQTREKSKMLTAGIQGHITLENVSFKYESRQQYVFRNMNIEIKPGQKVAFVGPSGCGKSTIVQLLQRFYLPEEGKITIDGIDIRDFDIHYLRSRFGVVSQQPVLFNASFRENIRYNKFDATEEQIREAAREANALSFIEGDQKLAIQVQREIAEEESGKGFDRSVGIKGSHISGGQKQRVAIARAILRNPQILLLDQATSALDAENQKRVQDSLDRIMASKTTLSIAHRIETIRNSDVINVFQKGEVVERGTYNQLLALKGFFYNLQQGTQFV